MVRLVLEEVRVRGEACRQRCNDAIYGGFMPKENWAPGLLCSHRSLPRHHGTKEGSDPAPAVRREPLPALPYSSAGPATAPGTNRGEPHRLFPSEELTWDTILAVLLPESTLGTQLTAGYPENSFPDPPGCHALAAAARPGFAPAEATTLGTAPNDSKLRALQPG